MPARRWGQRALMVTVSLLAPAVSGCASANQPTPSADGRWKTSHNLVTSSELASTRERTTAEALIRLRPEFVRGSSRGPLGGRPEVAIFLNGTYAGDVSTLNSIPLSVVREIAFLHPSEARLRLGLACACANGALLINTIRDTDR